MPKIDPNSVSVNTIRLYSASADREIVPSAVVSVVDENNPTPGIESARLTFTVDLNQLP